MLWIEPPGTILLECPGCLAAVNAETANAYEYTDSEQGTPIRFYFCKCPACHSPMVAVSENWGDPRKERDWDKPVRYLPRTERVPLSYPKVIGASFGEAVTCLKAKAYTAAAIMCRKTLEGICAEHQIKGRNLAESLRQMKETGVIDARLYEWADALRLSGNEAAHGPEASTTREDAGDIIEFTRALLEYVFTFRDKFEAFKKRRETTISVPAPRGA